MRTLEDILGSEPDSDEIEERDARIERMNRRHAVLSHGGKTRIMRFGADGDFTLETPQDMHTWYANDVTWTRSADGRDIATPLSKEWLQHPDRLQYTRLGFWPGGRAPRGAFNLWQGWGVDPNPDASCDLILKHIHEVVAAGDGDLFWYNVKYDAHMVQRPQDKPGVARVLRGGRGAGKDTYGELLVRMVGKRHSAIIGDSNRLTARFNSLFESALFAHIEEAFFSGDPRARGKLQHIITSRDITIERKGLEPFNNPSFLRVFMTTNEDWAIPAGTDERRYLVVDVSEKYKQDHEYFAALRAEIEGDGAGAYLAFLQSLDISDFDVRDVPQTDALADQKRETLDPLARWWEGELDDCAWWQGEDDESKSTVSKVALYRSYERYVQSLRFGGNPKPRSVFYKTLRKMCPDMAEQRGNRRDGRSREIVLPALDHCRRSFQQHIGISRRRSISDVLA